VYNSKVVDFIVCALSKYLRIYKWYSSLRTLEIYVFRIGILTPVLALSSLLGISILCNLGSVFFLFIGKFIPKSHRDQNGIIM